MWLVYMHTHAEKTLLTFACVIFKSDYIEERGQHLWDLEGNVDLNEVWHAENLCHPWVHQQCIVEIRWGDNAPHTASPADHTCKYVALSQSWEWQWHLGHCPSEQDFGCFWVYLCGLLPMIQHLARNPLSTCGTLNCALIRRDYKIFHEYVE